ncbi:MAG: response regulator [Hyphomonadaceae bacterium]|nr:response regulator [Hyphomonadaceae bacterium]
MVEDSDVQAIELKAILEDNGYEVIRAASAESALELLNNDVPDLIVADYQLPNMDGQELTRQLRLNERTRAVPIVLMTSDEGIGERAGLESGADVYVPKSRDPQPLLLRIGALLRGRRHNRSEPGVQFRRGQLLIIDSSATKRLQLQSELMKEGYLVTAVSGPEEGAAFAKNTPLDCVVINLLDARFEGVEACRLLAEIRDGHASLDGARQPFLVVGVGEGRSTSEGLLKAAFAAGVDDVVSSASDTELLRLRLRALVRRQLMIDEAQRLDDERRSARQALEQFRILVEGVTDYALYMLDPTGKVSTWNAGAERIKGYRASEIIGRNFSEFYTEEDRAAGEDRRALRMAREEGRYETEAQRVRKDGTRFWAHVIIDPIVSEEGTLRGYAKITRDITEKRAATEELQTARSALMHAQKMEAIGQLTGGIAHDFNNMLAGIIGALTIVKRRIEGQRYDEANKFIEAAQTSANRAASLTSRLLAFGRRQSLDIKPVDVNAAILSMRILLDRTMGENVTIETNFDAPGLWASTDISQLESSILNLAINARDAMPEGGVLRIETRSGTPAEGGGQTVSVSVRDSGTGIPPDVLANVFEPFFTTKPIGQGTGLGLSMVYGFVNQSGGSVQIDSEVDKGTVVTITLPGGSPDTLVEEAPSSSSDRQGEGSTVLVVEDDPQVRMLILEVLRDLRYRAIEASNPEQALAALRTHENVDLMVSDVGLPGMNGRQLAEIARRNRPNLKILFMTGYAAEAAVRSEFLDSGMEMLTKPFQLEGLTAKIREMIDAK